MLCLYVPHVVTVPSACCVQVNEHVVTVPSACCVQVNEHVVTVPSACCVQVNEHYLFHGTKREALNKIYSQGLSVRVANDRTMLGRGLYAAESSTKADQYSGETLLQPAASAPSATHATQASKQATD